VTGYTIRFAFPPPPIAPSIPVQRAEIVASYPHDPGAFTQGLLWRDGRLFESTGLKGASELREVRLEDGAVLRSVPFPKEAWGEGIADWGDEIIGLTLDCGLAHRWGIEDLESRGTLPCAAPGWGLARMGGELVLSDGTPTLRILDPETMALRRTLAVSEGGRPLGLINDLAFVKGELLANIFMTDTIARIDPEAGIVRARLSLAHLARDWGRRDIRDVLNGVAWDEKAERLFVTGKNWPRLNEISLPPLPSPSASVTS